MTQTPKVIIKENGPYLVYGSIPLIEEIHKDGLPDTKEFPAQEMIALCRCGQSKNKPFCDGSHIKTNWKAE